MSKEKDFEEFLHNIEPSPTTKNMFQAYKQI